MVIALAFSASATTVSNTVVNSSGINVTIWFVDSVEVDAIVNEFNWTYINYSSVFSVYNVSANDYHILTRSTSYNFTEPNANYSIGCLRVNVSTTADLSDISYYSSAYIVWTCEHSENLAVSNILSLYNGYYYVYKDGAYVETESANSYTIGEGYWEFSKSEKREYERTTKSYLMQAIFSIAQLMGLVAIVALIIIVVIYLRSGKGISFDWGDISSNLTGAMLTIMIAFIILILVIFVIVLAGNAFPS